MIISDSGVNRHVTQIPQWTSPLSHKAPFCYRNVHTLSMLGLKLIHANEMASINPMKWRHMKVGGFNFTGHWTVYYNFFALTTKTWTPCITTTMMNERILLPCSRCIDTSNHTHSIHHYWYHLCWSKMAAWSVQRKEGSRHLFHFLWERMDIFHELYD